MIATKQTKGNEKGFSLVEVLLAMVIGTIVLSALYMATTEGHKASTGIEQKISAQQDVRAAIDIMAMEIAMASFNPFGGTSLWINPANCATGALANNKGVQIATPSQLTIEMDINQNGSVADANEFIAYNYDTANQRITRQTGCAGGVQSFLGDVSTATANSRNVLVINNTVGASMFRYFDGNDTEIFPTSTNTAPIPNIRKIRVTIVVQAASPDFQGQSRRMTYSTDVIPRNHVVPAYLP